MQTPEAGADSSSTVPLQTSVPVQPAVTTQQVPTQVPVQQQVSHSGAITTISNTITVQTSFSILMFILVLFDFHRHRLFNRCSMCTRPRCSMWRRTAASTLTEPCKWTGMEQTAPMHI